MIIQNKKTGKRVVLSEAEYENLRNIGFAGRWTVISKDDGLAKRPLKSVPLEITDFSKMAAKNKQTKK